MLQAAQHISVHNHTGCWDYGVFTSTQDNCVMIIMEINLQPKALLVRFYNVTLVPVKNTNNFLTAWPTVHHICPFPRLSISQTYLIYF